MYLARFLYNIYEVKYFISDGYSFTRKPDVENGDWFLSECYDGRSFPLGYRLINPMKHERIKEKDVVFHEEETEIMFEVGDKVKINNELLTITDVIRNFDGSIDYHTNKREEIYINTYREALEELRLAKIERNENKEEAIRSELIEESKNLDVKAEKSESFFKKLFNKYIK